MKREWIIAEWFEYSFYAAKEAGFHPVYMFIMDTTEEPLYTMIRNQAELYSVDLHIGHIPEVDRNDIRDWNSFRFERMVFLRNELLNGVRNLKPKYFLSLDSDILMNRKGIKALMEHRQDDWDAIGGKAFMGHVGVEFPSYGMFRTGSTAITRQDQEGIFQVDCIMAIKLMTPPAYGVDYSYADEGEDIGFSVNCRTAGLRLGWDGSVTSKHVMREEDKDRVDPRCGY